MFRYIWHYFEIKHAFKQLNKGYTHVTGGHDWSHAKTVFFVNYFLANKCDVRVEDYGHKRFISIQYGTGEYKHEQSKMPGKIPNYPGAHRQF